MTRIVFGTLVAFYAAVLGFAVIGCGVQGPAPFWLDLKP
jgi:hypothetical protein